MPIVPQEGTMIDANLLIPAAQYVRKSTEHQRYSLENQSMGIEKYAASRRKACGKAANDVSGNKLSQSTSHSAEYEKSSAPASLK
jgi:hypothetical protein